MDFSKITVIKRQENIHGISTAEVLSVSTNYDAKLEDLSIFEGQLLFVETRREEGGGGVAVTTPPASLAKTKWQEVFENESNRITIKFNDPSSTLNGEVATVEYSLSIVVDNRSPVGHLRDMIAEKTKLSTDMIIMRRGGLAGVELKETNRTIKAMNFINNSPLYLEIGKPAKEGETRVIFYLAHHTPLHCDHALHTFTEVGELPVNGGLKVIWEER